MNNFSFNSQSEKDANSPTVEVRQKENCFDILHQRLDAWYAAKELAQTERAQVKKSFILTDEDPLNGEVKTYKLTVELLQTEKAALELPELSTWGSEVDEYVS